MLIQINSTRRDVCREDFFEFFQEFWHLIVASPPRLNWHIEYLCRELEKIAFRLEKGKPSLYDLVVNIPPGSTKSTIIIIANSA